MYLLKLDSWISNQSTSPLWTAASKTYQMSFSGSLPSLRQSPKSTSDQMSPVFRTTLTMLRMCRWRCKMTCLRRRTLSPWRWMGVPWQGRSQSLKPTRKKTRLTKEIHLGFLTSGPKSSSGWSSLLKYGGAWGCNWWWVVYGGIHTACLKLSIYNHYIWRAELGLFF